MKQLKIHGVSGDLHLAIVTEANRRGLSMNRYVLSLLESAAGLTGNGQTRPEFYDLDELAGTWKEEDAREFTQQLSSQRSIDETLWPWAN